MLQQRSCEPITSTGYNERLIVFISSVKKMFKMFTVGEMATNSLHANAGNWKSTRLSITDFVSVCKTSAVSLHLFFKCNEN